MEAKELRKKLEKSSDKFSIFFNKRILTQSSLTAKELVDLIHDFLTDEQKVNLFELSHFRNLSSDIKALIAKDISDDNLKLGLLSNSNFMSNLESFRLKDILKSLGNFGKMQILHQPSFLEEHDIIDIAKELIETLGDEEKQQILSDRNLVENELKIHTINIGPLIASLSNESEKTRLIELYGFEKSIAAIVWITFSDESKKKILLEHQYKLDIYDIKNLILSMSTDGIIAFLRDHKTFLAQNKLKPYQITKQLDTENQVDFISKFENAGLTEKDKKLILATLKPDTKEKVDSSNFSSGYLAAVYQSYQPDLSDFGIFVDLDGDLESYRDLDELIYFNPKGLSPEEKIKFQQLCEICPNLTIKDDLVMGSSTAQEYLTAELWIDSVIEQIDENWMMVQKLAYIDNAIGKKISYSPDYDTEVFDEKGARALWKIIASGYGVCNGIAQVEQYMLSKVGIGAVLVSGSRHSFLLLKDFELPTANGEIIRGDTINDPTWNLTAQRYGAKPQEFCKSYEKIRKHDIDEDGTDWKSHFNDETLSSASIELDEQSLKQVYQGIGLTDKNGNFPIKSFLVQSIMADKQNLPPEEAIQKQFEFLREYYPQFSTCENSTTAILSDSFSDLKNLKFNRCVINRVYAREDKNKRPVIYVYLDLPEVGKKFYYIDKETAEFIELSQKEFEEKFECYEMDLEKYHGVRPWQETEQTRKKNNLVHNSEEMIASEGEAR